MTTHAVTIEKRGVFHVAYCQNHTWQYVNTRRVDVGIEATAHLDAWLGRMN